MAKMLSDSTVVRPAAPSFHSADERKAREKNSKASEQLSCISSVPATLRILRYAGDFIPSWAGAVSIDLMPAVLVIILCVAHAGIRLTGLP